MSTSMLRPRQERFVEEFLIDGNATRAARAAGYRSGSADRLLQTPAVAAEIAARQEAEREEREAMRRRAMTELARVAFCDPATVISTPLAELPPELLACMGVSITETPTGRTVRARLPDRVSALNALVRHLSTLQQEETDPEEETHDENDNATTREELIAKIRYLIPDAFPHYPGTAASPVGGNDTSSGTGRGVAR